MGKGSDLSRRFLPRCDYNDTLPTRPEPARVRKKGVGA